MTLQRIKPTYLDDPEIEEIPDEILDFVETAQDRVNQYLEVNNLFETGFLGSDFAETYRTLRWIEDQSLATGTRFCEWGSGFGVVAGLASFLNWDSYGIEYDEELHEESWKLMEDFQLSAEFVLGSFVPWGAESLIDQAYQEQMGDIKLEPISDDAYDRLGWEIEDFDIIFCFPWPSDVELIERIFDRYASTGALLVTYRERKQLSLHRKM